MGGRSEKPISEYDPNTVSWSTADLEEHSAVEKAKGRRYGCITAEERALSGLPETWARAFI